MNKSTEKLFLTLLSACFLLLIVSCSSKKVSLAEEKLSGSNNSLSNEQLALIQEKLKVFPNQTEVAFSIIENGQISYYGVKRENDTLMYSDNHLSIFEIGSITKVFTSTLLAHYVINGQLNLDEKVNQYIQVPIKDSIQISLKSLSNHTSGLPRMPSNFTLGALLTPSNPYKNYTEEKFETYLTEDLKLSYEPGTKTEYSNLGAGLLGYTLCKFSNKDFQTQLNEYIFSKYDMTYSTTKIDEIKFTLIKGLDDEGDETSNWDLSALMGAGGILSNVYDLSKFATAQFDSLNKELELTRVKTFTDSTHTDIGLGWHIINTKSGNIWYWHNGATGGYTSSMTLDLKNKNGIIILSNVSAYNKSMGNIDKLGFRLIETLKPQE